MHQAVILALAAYCGTADPLPARYHATDELQGFLETIAANCEAASLNSFGTSREGRALQVLTLAAPGAKPPQERSALLITAGLDGDHLVGTEVALQVATNIIELHGARDAAVSRLLSEHTVFVIPCVNPDAQARFFATPQIETRFAPRPTDDDRDGGFDEDGPEDLNGDGLITQMRRLDPKGDHLPDADEPRLMRKASSPKGQRATHKIYTEGLDNDGDGEYGEDPEGGVDLNANFPHGYQEHETHVGPHPISEPETRALIEFVLAHPRIAIAVTYGRHNNLLKIDDSGKMDHTDKAPLSLHKDDVTVYGHIADRFKELTGIETAPNPPSDGAFFAWLYAQYGIPSFATSVWQRPDADGDEGEDDPADAEAEDDAEKPKRKEKGSGKGKDDKDEAFEDNLAWLKYSDASRDGAGFVEWTPYEHPDLGTVEIGGFVPYFRTNPPAEAIDAMVEKQLGFLLDLGERFPSVSLDNVEAIKRHDGVYEIKALLTNRGYFPTGLAIAEQNRRVRPIVVTPDVDGSSILGGKRVHKVWRIEGSGGWYELRWVVRPGERGAVEIAITSEKHGDFDVAVPLPSTPESSTGARP